MAEDASAAPAAKPAASGSTTANPNVKPKQNDAFRMLGLPNWRPKLPSRNWMIFLTVVGSWTGALVYDRRQKRKEQEKWCTLVSHVAHQTLPSNTLPRRITVYLAAPPGDGLRSAREHFVEYVKPVLVAGAMDWDVIEGRQEGQVRAGTAEKIRNLRRTNGESSSSETKIDVRTAVEAVRHRIGVNECPELQGDIVIGRHTWKEYVRGTHEGWLGPMDPPKTVAEPETANPPPQSQSAPPAASEPSPDPSGQQASEQFPSIEEGDGASSSGEEAQGEQKAEEKEAEETKEEEPPKPRATPAYIQPADYAASHLPRSVPRAFQPATPIQFPHLLGFLNTPIRMYRFLTRRYVADDIGRQTAAIVLAHYRPFKEMEFSAEGGSSDALEWEQQGVMKREEKEWHKRTVARVEGEGEREWIDEMVIDPRIGSRMRLFEVDAADEDRARRIGKGAAGIPGRPDLRVGAVELQE